MRSRDMLKWGMLVMNGGRWNGEQLIPAEFVKREFGDVTPGEGVMWDEPDCPLSKQFVDDMDAIGDVLGDAADVTQPWLLMASAVPESIPSGVGRSSCNHFLAMCPAPVYDFLGTLFLDDHRAQKNHVRPGDLFVL